MMTHLHPLSHFKNTLKKSALEIGLDENELVNLANQFSRQKHYELPTFYQSLKITTAIKLCEYLCIEIGMLQYPYKKAFHHRLIAHAIHCKTNQFPLTKKLLKIYSENIDVNFSPPFPLPLDNEPDCHQHRSRK